MSNLLNKNKSKNIERVETTPPAGTYNPSDVFTVKPEVQKTKEEIKEKSSTVRCSLKNKDRLNALVIHHGKDSVDEVLNMILNEHEANMSSDKKKEFQTLLKIYSKKR
ncbi:hypothetical protein [Heyndrickxia camelliae]|uniref:Uncharacterized protein n=1 Tax=Heyndrickxia camelliae TaxID=1707093 RepID=A0A2N3LET8_9BACI|nr:hypothetical protein [Heyndrickxia camelliae]PKR83067.1 hypothetical protein CWO92_21255 [Heyndrickxia camelliae]